MFFVELLKKYRSFISYVFFGVLTTVVNVVSYYIFFNVLEIPNVVSTAIAWVIAVVFAFITNKLWVFESKIFTLKILLYELGTFFVCRLLTGVLDVTIMWIAVDYLKLNAIIWKIVSNVLVIILNYIASKFLIFKRNIK